MNFKPILFSTEMVKAILSNRKTMTRREIKGVPEGVSKVWNDGGEWIVENEDGICWDGKIKAKYSIGDVSLAVNIRELQYSSRNNLLVNQSINPEQIAVENDSTPDRIRRTIIHTPSPAKVRAYLQYL